MAVETALSPIEALPVELPHRIFFYMDPQDVLSSRLACSIFAAIGIDHQFEDVSIFFKRQHFLRLLHIAHHPRIAKRVRSLHYNARRFNELRAYESWLHQPQCTVSAPSQHRLKHMALSELELQAAYQIYVAMHEDQEIILSQQLDSRCLATLFRYCPNLDAVTIDMSGNIRETERSLFHTAFAETVTDPICDTTWRICKPDNNAFGLQPFCAIATAFTECKRSLRRLELVHVSTAVMLLQP